MLAITNKTKKTLGKQTNPNEIYHLKIHYAIPQYSEWTVGPLSSVTCPPMFMQFTGCHQPVQGFYWLENAIDWLGKC